MKQSLKCNEGYIKILNRYRVGWSEWYYYEDI